MTLEDRLRDRLRAETAGMRPPGDLIDTLSRGHARRFKRARFTLAGGSLAATAVVAILLVGLLASPPPRQPEPQPFNAAEVLQRAKAADAATAGKIIHFRVTSEAMYNVQEIWVLRSEQIGRATSDSGSDHKIVEDSVVRAGRAETVNHLTRTVTVDDIQNEDMVERLLPPLFRGPTQWLDDPQLSVTQRGGEIHLIAPGRTDPDDSAAAFDVVLDPRTYLPVRGTFMGHQQMEISWLEATPENRRLLEHTVPPDYARS